MKYKFSPWQQFTLRRIDPIYVSSSGHNKMVCFSSGKISLKINILK